ncbi:MAG TPA: EamA family transporter [Niallia sp.]|nr:EamA family transporter [Niallia sp.]
MSSRLALLYIGIAASLWGIIGTFVTFLYNLGFSPIQVVTSRVICASLFLIIYVMIKDKKYFKIKIVDSKYFIGTGIVSIVFFNWCLFSAMEETSISVASILLYTAPAFVTIISRVVFKEALSSRKIVALVVTFIGCSLVIGVLPHSKESISFLGLVLGIGSGFFYALYTIFGKLALKKYHSLTVTVYTFIFAAVAIIPFSGVWKVASLFLNTQVWVYVIGLGLCSTMLPFILYTKGLTKIESSRASILATIEPVVASLLGFLIFKEQLNVWQYGGIILVIFAIIIVQETSRKSIHPQTLMKDS